MEGPGHYLPFICDQGCWLAGVRHVCVSALVEVYPTVEEAELKAGSVCRSN